MKNNLKYISSILMFFFAVYTFSPLYASMSGTDDKELMKSSQKTSISIGIYWLSVVFAELVGECGQGSTQVLSTDSDDAIFLLKKKRTISSKHLDTKPVMSIGTLPVHPEDVLVFTHNLYDVPHDLIHNHADGYYSLSTGLSPPIHLS